MSGTFNDQMRDNARKVRAKAKEEPPEIDWDKAIERSLKLMADLGYGDEE